VHSEVIRGPANAGRTGPFSGVIRMLLWLGAEEADCL
jgi:hypothetical protein